MSRQERLNVVGLDRRTLIKGLGITTMGPTVVELSPNLGESPQNNELQVKVKDSDGNVATMAKIILYNSDWEQIGSKATNVSGIAEFAGLKEGKYHIEAYQNDAFWATEKFSIKPGVNQLNIKQQTPRTTKMVVTDQKHGDGDDVLEVGEELLISPKIVHDESFPLHTRVRIFVGQTTESQGVLRGPIEIPAKGILPSAISGQGRQWFGRTFTPTEAGTYYIRIKTEAKYDEGYVFTHDTGWKEYTFGVENTATLTEFPYTNTPKIISQSNNMKYKPIEVTVDKNMDNDMAKVEFTINKRPGYILLGHPESQVLTLFNKEHVQADQTNIHSEVVGQNQTLDLVEGILTIDEVFTGPSPAKSAADFLKDILRTVAGAVVGESEFEYEPVPELTSKDEVRVIKTDFSSRGEEIAEFSKYTLSMELEVNEPTDITIVPDILMLVDESGHLVPKLRYRRQINIPLSNQSKSQTLTTDGFESGAYDDGNPVKWHVGLPGDYFRVQEDIVKEGNYALEVKSDSGPELSDHALLYFKSDGREIGDGDVFSGWIRTSVRAKYELATGKPTANTKQNGHQISIKLITDHGNILVESRDKYNQVLDEYRYRGAKSNEWYFFEITLKPSNSSVTARIYSSEKSLLFKETISTTGETKLTHTRLWVPRPFQNPSTGWFDDISFEPSS